MELDELTYKVNGCAMNVHNTIGNGFQEFVYMECLSIELKYAKINFEREVNKELYYKGQMVGMRRADFIIDNRIVVELKAIINLEDVQLAQAKNYVVVFDFQVGLLINFGSKSLQFKKIYNPKYSTRNNNLDPDPKK
jgi:GxxExxY protein